MSNPNIEEIHEHRVSVTGTIRLYSNVYAAESLLHRNLKRLQFEFDWSKLRFEGVPNDIKGATIIISLTVPYLHQARNIVVVFNDWLVDIVQL